MHNIKHVIVQAGGMGLRMESFTKNKPKCLIPINGKPLLYNLFDNFTNSIFHIIGNYKYNVLNKYLKTFSPNIKYILYKSNNKGTCDGIKKVIQNFKIDDNFILIWSDLLLNNEEINLIELNNNTIFVSNKLTCRWSIKDGLIQNIQSNNNGIIGMFYFKNKNILNDLPIKGEFVNYLSKKDVNYFNIIILNDIYEFKNIDYLYKWYKSNSNCRFFNNNIIFRKKTVVKSCLIQHYAKLLNSEINWYLKAKSLKIKYIPKIIRKNPFTIQKINGVKLIEKNVENKLKYKIIDKILYNLNIIHSAKITSKNNDELKNFSLSLNGNFSKILDFIFDEIIKNPQKFGILRILNTEKNYIIFDKNLSNLNTVGSKIENVVFVGDEKLTYNIWNKK